MKKLRFAFQAVCMIACLLAASVAMAMDAYSAFHIYTPTKLTAPIFERGDEAMPVILDADMVNLFDDGVAMMMLANSPRIELLGITTCIGNSWVEDGVAFAIRQLEGIGRTDIPVFAGINQVTRADRFAHLDEEARRFGRGKDPHRGCVDYPKPESWLAAYRTNFGEEPTAAPQEESAVDYIIRTVKERPHEVTIVTIGSGANMAAVLQKAPEVAPLIKRMIYMFGAFYHEGNVMPAAEFNSWIDPEAAKIMVRGNYPEQIFLPLDVCERISIGLEDYEAFGARIKKPIFRQLWDTHYMKGLYEGKPTHRQFVWDVLAAAVAIDPSLVQEEYFQYVDVNDVYSPSYGQTLAYQGDPPEGAQKAHIVQALDRDRLWPMIMEVFDRM